MEYLATAVTPGVSPNQQSFLDRPERSLDPRTPPQIAIHQAETVLVTEPDGQVKWPIYANGEQRDLLNGGAIAPHAARVFLTNRTFMSEERPIPASQIARPYDRPPDSMLQRNLLFTGVTRGKRLVGLVGQKKAVAIAVRNVSGRRHDRNHHG